MFKIQKRIIYAIEAVLDIALNAGVNPVQNVAVAKRQGIPKRYLEQTLQILVKNNILVASRGPRGGYRLARERRKIKILDIIKSITTEKEVSELYKSKISKIIIEPLINKFLGFSLFSNSLNPRKTSTGSVCKSAWVQPTISPLALRNPFTIPFP